MSLVDYHDDDEPENENSTKHEPQVRRSDKDAVRFDQ